MDENLTPNKQDMVDRKAAWIEKMFKLLFSSIQNDLKGTFLVLAVIVIIWQQITINTLNTLRIQDITSLNEKINAAVEKRVESKVSEQMVPLQAKQDSLSNNVDTSLLNLNGTLETVKKLIKNKK